MAHIYILKPRGHYAHWVRRVRYAEGCRAEDICYEANVTYLQRICEACRNGSMPDSMSSSRPDDVWSWITALELRAYGRRMGRRLRYRLYSVAPLNAIPPLHCRNLANQVSRGLVEQVI